MSVLNRLIAAQLHRNTRVSRADIFGPSDIRYMPIRYVEDAALMYPGYVGSKYRKEGTVVFGVNPGGGGDAYDRHPDDEELYCAIRSLVRTKPQHLEKELSELNRIFERIVQSWNLWGIFAPTLDALGVQLNEVCYLNAVPYRTRENKKPPVPAQSESWRQVIHPTLELLRPAKIVALGKAAGQIVARFSTSPARTYVVPRTNGDTYLCQDAVDILQRIQEERDTS